MNNHSIKRKQQLKGRIVSLSREAAMVEVSRYIKHAKYKKYFRKSKKYSAAFEGAERKVGESVVIESSRPLSKTKKWVIKNNL